MDYIIKFKNYYLTLKDVGIYRVILRVIYELKIKFYKLIPSKILNPFLNTNITSIDWLDNKSEEIKENKNKNIEKFCLKKYIIFNFLNEERKLSLPFNWNDQSWSRLWRFNLHYFEWSRQTLDKYFYKKEFSEKIYFIDFLIDDWISSNNFLRGDGWHSYTISYRIRNWSLLFRYYPELKNENRIKSLWSQTFWLYKNLEIHHGGNHLLENLISLIISTLNFKNKYALKIFIKTEKLLKKEISEQVLSDGGHYERSASYHLIILDHLIEMACLMQIINKSRPEWLTKIICKMTNWAIKIKLYKSNIPRFNDCSTLSAPNIDEVIIFASSYLKQKNLGCKSLRNKIIEDLLNEKIIEKELKLNFKKGVITFLPDTGWTIIRGGFNWELLFKCGEPCPKNNGAHAHSDLLSFDIFENGEPFINEVGTSTYTKGHIRISERSSRSHNTLQLKSLDNYYKDKSSWIEPIGVWDSFRVAKKSMPTNRLNGKYKDWFWAHGSHNGYREINATHKRWIALKVSKNKSVIFIIIDTIFSDKAVKWRRWFHLSEKASAFNWSFWPLNSKGKLLKNGSYYSVDFGKTYKRPLLQSTGIFKPGLNRVITVFSNKNDLIDFRNAASLKGIIKIKKDVEIHWNEERIPHFKN